MTGYGRLFVFLLTFAFGAWADVPHSMFEAGKHCVAYKVKKRTALSLFSNNVIGTNCDISAQLLPMVGGGYQVEVSIPIAGFDSGDKDRDVDVRQILKESEQSDILFRSKSMTEAEWRQTSQKSSEVLEGTLEIAGKSYPISTPVTITKVSSGIEVDGVAIVPFAKFDLKPPKVGGGLIAKADSDLELHFHLVSDKILGADKIVAHPAATLPALAPAESGVDSGAKEKEKVKPVVPESDDDEDDSASGDDDDQEPPPTKSTLPKKPVESVDTEKKL